MWNTVFGFVNVVALLAWIVLVAMPRKPVLLALVLYCGVGVLCLVYMLGLAGLLTGLVDPGGPAGTGPADFSTIAGIRAIFASDAGVAIGWTHYLAFDLFVGIWIARDADAKRFSRWVQAPILLATFVAGPLGLLVWLVVRDRRARASGRWA